jgi:hypothetical protein
MFGIWGGANKRVVYASALALLGVMVLWLGLRDSPPHEARDFEECVEQVEAKPASEEERKTSMTSCNAQFAARRKPGGGYSYFDFMQNRNFDIAGPNPTAEERELIDGAYMGFLDAQAREAVVSAQLARRQNEQLRADLESAREPVERRMVLKPANSPPLPVKRPLERSSKSTRCDDGALICGWAKLSAAVKNAFASSPVTRP